jgi:hypothetical protein
MQRPGKGKRAFNLFIMKTTKWRICFLVFSLLLAGRSNAQTKDTAHLFSPVLKAIIANNEAYGTEHKRGYSGIAELYNTAAKQKNLFVPKYAGLNFEHIFSGDSASYGWNMYECRLAPMKVIKHSGTKTELRQSRTQNWPLGSRIVYEAKNEGIEFTYTGTPLEDAWKKQGYIGLFFASYIYEPEQKGIYFIGQSKDNHMPHWIYHLPVSHGLQANHRPARSKFHPAMDTAGFPNTLALIKGVSDFEYSYPFFYGLRGDNVIIMMFEKPKEGEINFAQSPDGASEKDPAWDFIFYQRKYKIGKPFTFRGRVVYKRFEGKEDVMKTYEQWSGEKVVRPLDNR